MPTVLRSGPYRFFFYSTDRDEPQHIHARRDDNVAKFWLEPLRLERSGGFSPEELDRIERIVADNQIMLQEAWMSTSRTEPGPPVAQMVKVTEDTLTVDLRDGRTIAVPLVWFPRLRRATAEERNQWSLIGGGEGIHWEAVDEDISVEGLLAGRSSGESQTSLKKWLNERGAAGQV